MNLNGLELTWVLPGCSVSQTKLEAMNREGMFSGRRNVVLHSMLMLANRSVLVSAL